MTKMLRKLAGDRSGATAIEYGLIAAFIALAIAASLPLISKHLGNTFSNVNDKLAASDTASATSGTTPAN